jgi:iron complex outermembrane receptor protein
MNRDKMETTRWLFVLLLGLVLAGRAWAEETAPAKDVFTLGEIEVSGQAESGKSATMNKVDQDDMQDFNADRLNEAANLVPGVTLTKVGPRNESMLYIRGLDLKHAPIFLDGIPVYVPYDGYPDLARFTTFDLSELVIAKGAASVLYGPNTMGGAMNLVSKRPAKTLEGDAGAGYGSDDAYNAFLNVGSNLGSWYFQGGASVLSSETFPLSQAFTPTKAQAGGDRDNAYQHDDTLDFRVGYTPTATDEYVLSYSKEHGVKGVPPYAGSDPTQALRYWQWPYWNVENYRFTSNTDISSQVYVKLRAFYDIFQNSLYSYDNDTYSSITKPYAFKSWYDDHTDGGTIEVGTSWVPANLIKIAGHTKQDYHQEHNDGYPVQSFHDDVESLGLEDTVTLAPHVSAVAGISHDSVTTLQAQDVNAQKQLVDFPHGATSAWNPQLCLFYAPDAIGTFHVSVADKSRLPSIKDKYSYRLGTAIPNPDLQAERSVNYEAGYAGTMGNAARVEANAFYNDVSDYILLKTIPNPSHPGKTTTQNQNVEKVRLYGAEFEASVGLLTNLEAGANYTLLRAENETTSDELVNIPEHKAILYLHYTPLEKLKVLADAEYDSSRYSTSNGLDVAGDFIVVNFKLNYELIRGLVAEAGIKNLFDRNYALEEGYPEPGRTYFGNLRYSF